MAVVGGVKGKDGDLRVLQPLEQGHPYHEYRIQALDGNEETMDILRPKYAPRCIARADIHFVDAAISHKADKPVWLTITDESMLELASDYMFAAKMKGFTLGSISGNTISVLNEPDRMRICVHGELHRSNNASILFYRDRRVIYNCHSSKCVDQEPYLLGTWQTTLPNSMDEMIETSVAQYLFGGSHESVDQHL